MNLSPFGQNYDKQSSFIMRNAVNNHFWLGLLSTFDYKINKALSLSGGIDLRTYKGEHYREVDDLFGGNFFLDTGDQNEDNETTKKYEGDKIAYNNDALVRWGGLFAQLKYQRGNITSFINVTGSYSGYKRIDHFIPKTLNVGDTTMEIAYGDSIIHNGQLYDHNSPGLKTNETDWKYLPGFTVKGGVNYNLSETMNVFLNLGYISKAQRFSNVFDRQNQLFLEIENEKVKAIELGYSYVRPRLTLNVNAYYTVWENKPSDQFVYITDTINQDVRYTVNINNMNALHMGAEFEFAYRITPRITLESLLSVGDWKWTSRDTALIFNDNGQQVGTKPFDARGLYVGDAAQIQTRHSLRWEIIDGLYVSGVFTWFGKHYAEFNPLDLDPEENPWAFDENGNPRQSWKIPDYFMADLHAGYSWKVKDLGFQIRGSVLNLLDGKYITDAQNNDTYLGLSTSNFDVNSASVFMGMGRRFNLSLRINL